MNSTELYYLALSQIPVQFISPNTRGCIYDDGTIILANPEYPPMRFTDVSRKWEEIKPNPFIFVKGL